MSIKSKILLSLLLLAGVSFITICVYSLISLEDMGRFSQKASRELSFHAINDGRKTMLRLCQNNLINQAKNQAAIADLENHGLQSDIQLLAILCHRRFLNISLQPIQMTWDSLKHYSGSSNQMLYVLPEKNRHSLEALNAIKVFSSLKCCARKIYSNNKFVESITLVSPTGAYAVFPAHEIHQAYNPFNSDWYKSALTSTSIKWSKPYVCPLSQKMVATCFIQVKGVDGKTEAVIGVNIGIQKLVDSFINPRLGSSVFSFLLDESGSLLGTRRFSSCGKWELCSSNISVFKGPNKEISAMGRAMISGGSGIVKLKAGELVEKASFVAYAWVPTTRWSVGVAMPVQDVLKPIAKSKEFILNELALQNNSIRNNLRAKLRNYLLIGVFFVLLVVFFGVWIAEKVTKPFSQLINGTRDIGAGEFDNIISIKSGDELEELAMNFNSMSHELKTYMNNLEASIAGQQKIENELAVAAKIQQAMLPHATDELFSRNRLELDATMLPAAEVGGDFYDWHELGKDRFYFCIGDVCDRGIPAALFMAQIKTLLAGKVNNNITPEVLLAKLNKALSRNNESCMFAKIFCGIIDFHSREMTFCNAGYTPPFFIKDGTASSVKCKGCDIPVGPLSEEKVKYNAHKIALDEFDGLVLYSDAVTALPDNKGEHFGKARLEKLINEVAGKSAEEIVSAIKKATLSWGNMQEDDITILCMKLK
ncbi:SpoIIE family protein phosphatase [Lentisphaerota bacterium ZTH]|nr:SpoIIE family protein phosphatase [Lentisphaerota bacterium]WET07671.1 SpoIIE family protein phosphatase [Lentisphaerota bacterium ZTH]